MPLARPPIGEILLRHEHLRPRELERLLAEPDRKQRLVSMLILRAEIEIDDATLALSEQTGYPGALERHLEQRDAALAKGFPQPLMKACGVVPLVKTVAGALVVIARDPSPALADHLRTELGGPIELAVAPAIFVERLVQRLAGGLPALGPPQLPPSTRPAPARGRKSISAIMNVPVEQVPEVRISAGMPTVELPKEPSARVIQIPERTAPVDADLPPPPGLTLELDGGEPEPATPPQRPTRPIPVPELGSLLEVSEPTPPPHALDEIVGGSTIITDQPASDDPGPAVSQRPTRPSVVQPLPTREDSQANRQRATPNIIKRPPTPLPFAPRPQPRMVSEPRVIVDPSIHEPGDPQLRPTFPKLEPPPPSVFDAETARPQTAIVLDVQMPDTPKPPDPAPVEPPKPRPRTTTDNWEDFEDSKVGMGVPPPDVLDQMSSIGITPPPVDVEPPATEPPLQPRPSRPRAERVEVSDEPTRSERPAAMKSTVQGLPTVRPPARPPSEPATPVPSLPRMPRPASEPTVPAQPIGRIQPRPATPPPIPRAATPPPIPKAGATIVRDIEKALSRATADRLLMKHVATKWSASLLVNIVDDRARGARGHGPRLDAGVEAIELPIASSGLLRAAIETNVPVVDQADPLFELLGKPARPSSAPVVVDDRVVAVLAAGDPVGGDGTPDELRTLASALAVAYQRFK